MGAIVDFMTFGDAGRLRLRLWVALVALLGTQTLQQFTGVDLSAATPLLPSVLWLPLLLGGTLFGFGMVSASGCLSRALARTGESNLNAVLVLIVVGLATQMILRGVFSVPGIFLLDPVRVVLVGPPDLPLLPACNAGISLAVARWLVRVLIALPALAYLGRDKISCNPRHCWAGWSSRRRCRRVGT